MKEIIILGSGAVGAEVSAYVDDINAIHKDSYVIKGFLDDSEANFERNAKKYAFTQPYLGTVETYPLSEKDNLIFGFANIASRKRMIERLADRNVKFATIIHPSSQVAASAVLGNGNIIYPNCVIGPGSRMGDNNLITSFSFISHDCIVGDNNFFATAGLSGNVTVGDNNFFGIRSVVIPSITIGSGNTLQAGMTIDKNVGNDETVFYRFKEKVIVISKENQ
jgi:sugar O-acyltransferase (sialic acid O-acetyltransferase NeuD family)